MRFQIDSAGWANGALHVPSPNFEPRMPDSKVDLLVVHNISLPPGEFGGPFVADLFLNRLDYDLHPYFAQLRSIKVSAHLLIRRDGAVVQFVSCNDKAWHAGVSSFCGKAHCNDFSIGVELEGTDVHPFLPAQYDTLAELTLALQSAYPLSDVAGHEHIAPGRKTDPGPYFDWKNYVLRYNNSRKHICHNPARYADLTFPLD